MALVKVGDKLPVLNPDHVVYVEELPPTGPNYEIKIHLVGGAVVTMRDAEARTWAAALKKQAQNFT